MISRGLDPHLLFPSSQAADLPQDYGDGVSPAEGVQALALPQPCAPAPLPCASDRDQISNEHLRAKRARVESIIQGMSLPPNPLSCDTSRERADTQKGCETPRENKRKPRVPQQQQSDGAAQWAAPGAGSPQAQGCQQLKAQLRFLEQQLRQLQEKFFQVCDPGDAVRAQEGMEKAHLLCGKPGGRSGKDSATAASDPLTVPFWRSVPEMAGHEASEEEEDAGNAGGLPSEARELSEMLKHELAGATSRAVDSVLKTMWLKFSRCITSQLIKWFSNFREFYYIQVEKFARQALLEGVADAKVLRVSRDSELFRALNMHYNKGNDFEVPARFLEVASLTLQEFFSAVRAGKDSDPSWKKPIYKIISKLDSDIPEVFKSSGCSQELLRS
nr:PREDICTED: prospero homeobox protein 2 [Struthio camelus australis]